MDKGIDVGTQHGIMVNTVVRLSTVAVRSVLEIRQYGSGSVYGEYG